MNNLTKYEENPVWTLPLIYLGIGVGGLFVFDAMKDRLKEAKKELAELSIRMRRSLPWAGGAAGLHIASEFVPKKYNQACLYGALGSASIGLIQAIKNVKTLVIEEKVAELKDLDRLRIKEWEAKKKLKAGEEKIEKEKIAEKEKKLESLQQKVNTARRLIKIKTNIRDIKEQLIWPDVTFWFIIENLSPWTWHNFKIHTIIREEKTKDIVKEDLKEVPTILPSSGEFGRAARIGGGAKIEMPAWSSDKDFEATCTLIMIDEKINWEISESKIKFTCNEEWLAKRKG